MIKRKYITLALVVGLACGSAIVRAEDEDEEAQAAPTPTYIFPQEVKCKKHDKVIFCTDLEGKPLTGEMIKTTEGEITRRYQMENGYINGTATSYDIYGRIKKINEYKNGIKDGWSTQYDDGNIISKIPYVKGQKEGVAVYNEEDCWVRLIYINDKINGATQLIDKKEKKPIYELNYADDQITSGTYYYKDGSAQLSPIDIEGLNRKCFNFHTSLSEEKIPFEPAGSNEECDQEWRQENRKAVIDYIKKYQE